MIKTHDERPWRGPQAGRRITRRGWAVLAAAAIAALLWAILIATAVLVAAHLPDAQLR